ncbi:hypothetical protein PTTG_26192 [Puccinia triticina 1-1 BBBD Race 1]|uniref:MYND-type domain-containing protein n=1 Tax=Puccinia triticina (isolate 1-1 / race 1 (BBBD)) TaxID=630390 RepID=A0A180GX32_PUCT1|nr:hypothetical protein PTTG_26192 [Puccinia triticina 1-1 BBBD Race 1]
MRESNFYFPAHNKASVSITSALYDRRAIDATSPLPLLSTLTHLSYLTSTSPRIREILCSDGGLERLISILRSTGARMREQRRLSQPHPQQPQPQPAIPIRSSPFRPFLTTTTTTTTTPSAISQPTHLTLQPPTTNHQTPTPAPPANQIALTKDQKQLLWTWSLSFQCVVNIGVRGTESIRTRVVEAGVVPVIISVLGGYLHEMERLRQQSENHERARKKAVLDAASSTAYSRYPVPNSQSSYAPNADLPRPPAPSSPLAPCSNPSETPSRNSPTQTSPPELITTTTTLPPATPSAPPLTPPHQSSSSSSSSSQQLLLLNNNNSNQPISPSSVSSSSSLETSRLHLNQQAILRNDGSTSSTTLDHDLIDVDPEENHAHSNSEPRSTTVAVEMDDQSAADESEADVVMELVGDDEAGPSNGRQRSRRGTIKASQANAHKVVHITPLAPPRPTLTELDHENLPLNPQSQQPSPMEGLETDVNNGNENDPERGSSPAAILYANHQTPRASSARLPHSGAGRSQAQHSSAGAEDVAAGGGPVSEDVLMTGSSESATLTSNSASETDYSPPLDPSLGAPQATHTPADAGQLSRVLSENEGTARAFTPRRQAVPPPPAPAPATNVVAPAGRANANTARPAPPSAGSTSLSAPVTLAFRDEDVLLALQLLAYLSKYAHVRAYFHEPANRSTLELTYGSIHDATRALAKFSGRFKSERYERERGKEFAAAADAQGSSSSRRPASAQGQHSAPDAHSLGSSIDLSARLSSQSHHHHPHRSYSSSMVRARMQVEEALEDGRHGQDPSASRAPSSDPGADGLRPALLLGGVTLFSTSPMVNSVPQILRQPSFVLGQAGAGNLVPGVAPVHGSHHQHYASSSSQPGPTGHHSHDPDPTRMIYNAARAQLAHPPSSSSTSSSSSTTINPLASNVFSYVERFTHQRLPHDVHSPSIPSEIQYWAGVIMRNACRKDETRGGIRQCANMQCGRWEQVPREFAKCRRCRKAKYCSKNCQSRAWQHGHRFWCSTRAEGESSSSAAAAAAGTTATTTTTGMGEGVDGEAVPTDEASRPAGGPDRASRALVDAAIERLRSDRGGRAGRRRAAGSGGTSSEAASNIATPPDRDLRIQQPDGLLIPHTALPILQPVVNPQLVVVPADQLVDERHQIRLMVQNQPDQTILHP